ncbi:MAG: hypothetical protein R2722_02920 [Tessaracoccus sp.]
MANGKKKPTMFRLDVDLEAVAGDPAEELARILRYWGGNMKHYDFEQVAMESLRDSEGREVGRWSLS